MSILGYSSFKRRQALPLVIAAALFFLWTQQDQQFSVGSWSSYGSDSGGSRSQPADGKFHWASVPLHYPIAPESVRPVPTAQPGAPPRIQHAFDSETSAERKLRLSRLELVKSNFTHAWGGYKQHAWMSDEVQPISGGAHNPFGGWAATLVDSLDTLWIMGLHAEFDEAVRAVDGIDFTTSSLDEINVFETTIRYMGGLLSAYDISGGRKSKHAALLLRKVVELGDMLYVAFDTPNHMPITRWKPKSRRHTALTTQEAPPQVAPDGVLVAEIGSLTLEFTRLSQVSGDPKYFDAVQRIMEVFAEQQDRTKLPGMWPVVVNAQTGDFSGDSGFTIGGMADSVYEYLPKQYLLLGSASQMYRDLYVKAVAAMKRNIFFRPRTKTGADMLVPGDARVDGSIHPSKVEPDPRVQHLGCFAGGMVGLASRAFAIPGDMDVARRLVEGCLWGYENGPSGIMPEIMHTTRCPDEGECHWDEAEWHREVAARLKAGKDAGSDDGSEAAVDIADHISRSRLTPGVTSFDDTRYILRPEAIESIFILYRLTGDKSLMDRAWRMFETITRATQTDIAHAALSDCTLASPASTRTDSMESFWLAETLKYFYLIYETPEVVSLDEFVLNTEAHPLRMPR